MASLILSYEPQGQNLNTRRWGKKRLRSEREQALAKTTLALLGECDVSPTPDNYELFYTYAAGENPAVGRIIGDMIAQRRPFTLGVLRELRERSSARERAERAVENIGENVSVSLDDAVATLEEAAKNADEYGKTLLAASGELAASSRLWTLISPMLPP